MPRVRRFRPGPRVIVAVLALVALVVASVLLLGQSTPPHGRTLDSIFEDDQLLVDQPPTPAGNATVAATLATLKSLGVDRIRVIVIWRDVAPGNTDTTEPAGFDPADPGGRYSWGAYDRIDDAAAADGIKVDFDLSAPAPTWSLTAQPAGTRRAATADADLYEPSAADFQQFVEAAGRRYSGSYRPSPSSRYALPRVSFWSVWNEPNQPGWLSPQRNPATGDPVAPSLYRSLVDGFWNGLSASGHTTRTDTILVGELAPNGCLTGVSCAFAKLGRAYFPVPPITFLEDLYCVGPTGSRRGSAAGSSVAAGSSTATGSGSGAAGLTPLRGDAATAVGCPARAGAGSFAADNPALFHATGLSEHPYSFSLAPNVSAPHASFVPLADLSRLESTLDAAQAADGQGHSWPLYLTEYGYVTNPPNPDYEVTPAQQAMYLDEATYIAAQDPRVRALAQFELQDSDPAAECQCQRGSPDYWHSFQEGLEYLGGRPKPAYGAYRVVIFLPDLEAPSRPASPDTPVEVWGMLRAAPDDSTQTGLIEWQPAGGGRWRVLARSTTRDPSGIINQDVVLPATGSVRLAWMPLSGSGLEYSRNVAVTVR
jgi:hypothetical protein